MTLPGAERRHVAVHRYEGTHEDRYLVVLVEPDGRWWERSAYLSDRDAAGEAALVLAGSLGVRLGAGAHAGRYMVGGGRCSMSALAIADTMRLAISQAKGTIDLDRLVVAITQQWGAGGLSG